MTLDFRHCHKQQTLSIVSSAVHASFCKDQLQIVVLEERICGSADHNSDTFYHIRRHRGPGFRGLANTCPLLGRTLSNYLLPLSIVASYVRVVSPTGTATSFKDLT